MCEAGTIPSELPLCETPRDSSSSAPDLPRSQRSAWNVRDSDGTLILRPANAGGDAGTDFTAEQAERLGRALLIVDPWEPESAVRIGRWIDEQRLRTLNVAGPSENTAPGIGDRVHGLLLEILRAKTGRRPGRRG